MGEQPGMRNRQPYRASPVCFEVLTSPDEFFAAKLCLLMHDGCRKHDPNARSVILKLQVAGKLTNERRYHPSQQGP
jgi:hypothetical protein